MQDVILRIYRQTTRGDNNNKKSNEAEGHQFEERDADEILGGNENHYYSKRVKYGDECEEVSFYLIWFSFSFLRI